MQIRKTFKKVFQISVAIAFGLKLVACTSVPMREQANLAKPGMQFSASANDPYAHRLVAYLHPGASDSSSVSTTCSSCR